MLCRLIHSHQGVFSMPRGGPRHHAGRKKERDLDLLRKMIDRKITLSQWEFVLDALLLEVRRGGHAGVRAAELLWRYRFGIPTAALHKLAVAVVPDNTSAPDADPDAPLLPAST